MLKFSAVWCGPCKVIAPVIDKLAPQYPQVFMGDVDVDEVQEVAQEHKVTAMPTFVFLTNGIETKRVVGGDVTGIVAALKDMQDAAPGFGTSGSRLGASSSKPAGSALRDARLRALARKNGESAAPQVPEEKVKAQKSQPQAAPQAWSLTGFIQSLLKYIVLYIATLFSLDSRATASSLSR